MVESEGEPTAVWSFKCVFVAVKFESLNDTVVDKLSVAQEAGAFP